MSLFAIFNDEAQSLFAIFNDEAQSLFGIFNDGTRSLLTHALLAFSTTSNFSVSTDILGGEDERTCCRSL